MSNIRACTRADTTGRLDDLALAFRSGVRALAMSESHVRKVIDSAAVLCSIRLRIWGSEVRILPGAPDYFVKSIFYAGLSGWIALAGDLCPSSVRNRSLEVPNLAA